MGDRKTKTICEFCMVSFSNLKSLQKHIKEQHKNAGVEKEYICKRCHKRFDRKESLQKHFQTHLRKTERKLFKCSHCKETFTFKFNMVKHILDVHGPLCS